MKIQIVGMGCPKCKKLYEEVKKAVDELGLKNEIEKVEDINAITDMDIMITPALVVNGVVKSAGKVPGIAELKKLIR